MKPLTPPKLEIMNDVVYIETFLSLSLSLSMKIRFKIMQNSKSLHEVVFLLALLSLFSLSRLASEQQLKTRKQNSHLKRKRSSFERAEPSHKIRKKKRKEKQINIVFRSIYYYYY